MGSRWPPQRPCSASSAWCTWVRRTSAARRPTSSGCACSAPRWPRWRRALGPSRRRLAPPTPTGGHPSPPPTTSLIRRRDMTFCASVAAETRISRRSSSGCASSMPEAVATGARRIEEAFAAARAEGRAALMPYLVAGFPETVTSAAVADAYAASGADLVELGGPFSDPLADGPVIHAAATRALAAGATLESALELCERIASAVPVVPMVYANMVLARGPEEFALRLADAGACGPLVPP